VRDWRTVLARGRALLTGRRTHALDDEIASHLAMLTEDFERRGLDPDAARQAASRAFGGTVQVREAYRDQLSWRWLDAFAQDLRVSARMLRRNPGFTLTATLTLALGIGANVAIFSVLDALLLRALPVSRPGELVLLSGNYSFAAFRALAQSHRESIDLLAVDRADDLAVRIDGTASERVSAAFVSGNYFSVLGVPPAIGSVFAADVDGRVGSAPVIVISDRFWRARFGAAVSVVGRTLNVAGTPLTIVGVTPGGFFGERVGEMPDLWVPLSMRTALVPGRDLLASSGTAWLTLMGRVQANRSEAQIAQELTQHYRAVLRSIFGTDLPPDVKRDIAETTISLSPAGRGLSSLRGRYAAPLWVLMTVVALILLLACTNVANLLLARATARRREIDLRLALGISRSRLIRQLLIEAALLSSLGAGAGLLVAWPARETLLKLASADGTRVPIAVTTDVRLLAFVVAIAAATTMLFGLVPAIASSRSGAGRALRAPRALGEQTAGLTSSVLLVGQVAIAVVLLIGAGLFVGTLANLRHVDLRFSPAGRLIVDVDPLAAGFHGAEYSTLVERLTARLSNVPGVSVVAVSENGALQGRESSTDRVYADGADRTKPGIKAAFDVVGARYLAASGVPIAAGRDLAATDRAGSELVVVVNESLARALFGVQQAIGRRMHWDKLSLAIVGVARDANYNGPRGQAPARFYLPYLQHADRAELASARFIVSADAEPSSMVKALAASVTSEEPRLSTPVIEVATDLVDRTLSQERLLARLSAAFAAVALTVTGIGLYGVLAYRAARRTAEFALRLALGASRARILAAFLRHEFVLVLAGLGLGLPLAVLGSRLISSLLYGVGPTSPGVLGVTIGLTLMAGAAAAIVPLHRTGRVNAMDALSAE